MTKEGPNGTPEIQILANFSICKLEYFNEYRKSMLDQLILRF
jgi:hypothetical protein